MIRLNRIFQAIGGVLCGGLVVTAQAQVHELKVSLFTPGTNDINIAFEQMGKVLEQKSGGHLKLKLFHASQLGPPPRQYDLVRTGVADLTYHLHGLNSGRFPLTEVIELPGMITTGDAASKALNELLPEYLAAEHPGTRVLGFMTGPPLPLMTTKIPIRSLSDLKGRRIRHPGPTISATLSAVGATPVAIQPGDLHDSLAKGVVDGAVTGFTGASAFKLHELIRYVADWNFGGITFVVVMNPAAYDKLSAEHKKLIDEFSGKAGEAHWANQFDISEAKHREGIIKAGATITRLEPKEQAAFEAIAAKLQESTVAELERKGLPGKAYFAKLKQAIARHTK